MATVTPKAIYHGSTLIWPVTLEMETFVTPDNPSLNIGSVTEFTATTNGTNAPYTYQWKKRAAQEDPWIIIEGATAETYSYTAVAEENGWRLSCDVRDKFGHLQPDATTLTILPQVTSSIVAAPPFPVVQNTEVVITCTAGGGNGTYTYQWYKTTDGVRDPVGDGTNILTQPNANPTTTPKLIECEVTSNGATVTSNIIEQVVYATPTVTIAPTSGAGYSGAVVAFTATPAGGNGTYTYQWNVDGAPVSGQTAATYSHTIAATATVTCTVTSAGAPVTSAGAAITMWAAPTASIAPTSFSGLEGAAVTFTCTPGGGNGAYTYQWYKGGVAVGGQTAATYAYTAAVADNGATVYCAVTSAGAVVNSNSAPLTVTAPFHPLDLFGNGEHGDFWRFDVANSNATAVNTAATIVNGLANGNNLVDYQYGTSAYYNWIRDQGGTQYMGQGQYQYSTTYPFLWATLAAWSATSGCEIIVHCLDFGTYSTDSFQHIFAATDVAPGSSIQLLAGVQQSNSSTPAYNRYKTHLNQTNYGLPREGIRGTARVKLTKTSSSVFEANFYLDGNPAPLLTSPADYVTMDTLKIPQVGFLGPQTKLVAAVMINRYLTDQEWADIHSWFMAQ